MNDYGIGPLVTVAIAGIVMMPLGLWKLVEIILWVWARVHWGAP